MLWTVEMDNGVVCAAHWEEAQQRWAVLDTHPVAAFCTLPGTEWLFSDQHPPGHCVLPVDDETAAALLEAHLALPSAEAPSRA